MLLLNDFDYKDRGIGIIEAWSVFLTRIVGVGFLNFPSKVDMDNIEILGLLLFFFNLVSAIYSSFLSLRLSCEFPQFK